jgi:anti-anti-sigma regulatory factor
MLIGAYTSVKKVGGQLVLTNVVDRIRDILFVTKLFLLFKTFDDENDAIDYLVEKS